MKVPYSDAQLRTEFMVPGSCVGRIIGKKGQVVQDIQDKAQTDIEVPKDKQGGDDVPVYITGTFNGTQVGISLFRYLLCCCFLFFSQNLLLPHLKRGSSGLLKH